MKNTNKIILIVISGFVLSVINGILFKKNIISSENNWIAAIGFIISTMLIMIGLYLYSEKIKESKTWLSILIKIFIGFYLILIIIGISISLF